MANSFGNQTFYILKRKFLYNETKYDISINRKKHRKKKQYILKLCTAFTLNKKEILIQNFEIYYKRILAQDFKKNIYMSIVEKKPRENDAASTELKEICKFHE